LKTKITVLILLIAQLAIADGGNNTNSNNTIIVKPQITVKGCCESNCKKKVKVVTKVVEKPVVVTKTVEKVVYVDRPVIQKEVIVLKKARKKNRISLLGGVGPTQLEQPSQNTVNLVKGPVGGIMYQRSMTESFNLGVQVQTNQTVLGSVGLDF
jgi:hypothetical protein